MLHFDLCGKGVRVDQTDRMTQPFGSGDGLLDKPSRTIRKAHVEHDPRLVGAAQYAAVERDRRFDTFAVVDRYSPLEILAGGMRTAQITLAQSQYPVRLHKHRRFPQAFTQMQAFLSVFK